MTALTTLFLVLICGTDTTLTSKPFTVHEHWKIVCHAENAGANADITVFVDPQAGTQNVQVIHMTGNGEKTAYYRDAGTFKIAVNGWDASWRVTVEDGK